MKKLTYILILISSIGFANDSTLYTFESNLSPSIDQIGIGALNDHLSVITGAYSCSGSSSLDIDAGTGGYSNWVYTDYIDLGDDFDVSFCVRITNINEEKILFSNYIGTSGFKIGINTSLQLFITTGDGVIQSTTTTNSSVFTINTFYNVRVRLRTGVGSNPAIYINDVYAVFAGSYRTYFPTDGYFYIGCENSAGLNRTDSYWDDLQLKKYIEVIPADTTLATETIQAESHDVGSNVTVDGSYVTNWKAGSYTGYENIMFNNEDYIKMRINCHADSAGQLEIRTGSPSGTLLTTLDITSTSGAYQEVDLPILVDTGAGGVGAYPYGTLPTNVTTTQALASWNEFKALHLVDCGDDRARMAFGREGIDYEFPDSTASETQGYSITWAAYFEDQAVFDKLFNYYDYFKSVRGLMNWLINACNNVAGTPNATDADIDAAFGLIVAHYVWGSDGDINYMQEALDVIAAIKLHCIETTPLTYVLKPGSVWGGSDILNPSYYAPAYFRVFGKFSNDVAFWEEVIDVGYEIINRNLAWTGAKGSLVSDWCEFDGSCPDSVVHANRTCHYKAEAMRTPWRHSMFYAWYGDSRAKTFIDSCNTFISWVGGIEQIKHEYWWDGTPAAPWHTTSAVSTFACAGLGLQLSDQSVINNYFNEIGNTTAHGHFDFIFRLYAQMLGSGMLYNPIQETASVGAVEGLHDLYFISKETGVVNVDWFTFFVAEAEKARHGIKGWSGIKFLF